MKSMTKVSCCLAAALLALSAGAFTLVSAEKVSRIVVGSKEPDCVWLAAEDLKSDVRKIAGRSPELVRGASAAAGDVFIVTKEDGRWEAYSVGEREGVLRIVGSDARGTMFGVYDFIERYLGVDPLYYWSDVPYPRRDVLAWDRVVIDQPSPSIRFRGWFINDEDMLTMWKKASGIRDYSSYGYYNVVIGHETMSAIAESLVRSRMNLIIPASFLNISRPAEEGLVAICSRRGVYVSMHHIEPMGVSGFTFTDYWRKRGRRLEYSYFKHPEELTETWREMAKRWAKYPNVIWQIGLRGTADRPMWEDDPTMPRDDAGRANLISAALAHQVAVLDEVGVPKERRVVTTTLWGEGAYFNERGLLKIPQGTVVVMADNNCGWRWQKDLMEGERAEGVNYGVYYHHQLCEMGPHLVSLVPAAKTCEMLLTARAKGAGHYAIFNVGNVREFVCGLDATSKMTWNLDAFDPAEWTRAWLGRRVPSNAAAWETAQNVYYRAVQLKPDTGVPRFLDGQMWIEYEQVMNRIVACASGKARCEPDPEPAKTVFPPQDSKDPFCLAIGDMYPPLASPSDTCARLAAQRMGFEQALLFARRALAGTAPSERRFARDFLVYPAEVMSGLTQATLEAFLAEEAVKGGDRAGCAAHLEAAAAAVRGVMSAGEGYCHGWKWKYWYRGCDKIAPRNFLRKTLEALDAIRPQGGSLIMQHKNEDGQ